MEKISLPEFFPNIEHLIQIFYSIIVKKKNHKIESMNICVTSF